MRNGARPPLMDEGRGASKPVCSVQHSCTLSTDNESSCHSASSCFRQALGRGWSSQDRAEASQQPHRGCFTGGRAQRRVAACSRPHSHVRAQALPVRVPRQAFSTKLKHLLRTGKEITTHHHFQRADKYLQYLRIQINMTVLLINHLTHLHYFPHI